MRVLFVSPLDPEVPGNLKLLMGGENTYTRMLLAYPPAGIKFIHYEEAIKRGLISYHWSQNFFLWLQKLRILPLGPRVQAVKLDWQFDLVYVHAFPVKLAGRTPPLIISDSSSNLVFLTRYLNWPRWRIKSALFIKSVLFEKFNVIDGEVNTEKANAFFVFSEWAKKIKTTNNVNQRLIGLGSKLRTTNCKVIYPGLPTQTVKKNMESPRLRSDKKDVIRLLFVGVWFERKGGRILLRAFRNLRKKHPHVHLTILGPLPLDISTYRVKGIEQKDFVPYKELSEYYQTHDILVHVPPEIEGYGMTVPEAMSYGMIPVVSDICVLPEFVEQGKNGLVVKAGSVVELEKALEKLITSPQLRRRLSQGARKKFNKSFSLPVFQKRLVGLFHHALVS